MSETPSHSLLTVKETAEYLRIPLPTVYYLVQRGQIPAIQIGGRWRIKKISLDRDILREEKQGQRTVLVVDDDLGIQELFKTFLKKTGFNRVAVGTAKEAISSLRKQKFDLMFLDIQLPDEPGDQVYKTAKQLDPSLNIIVITGYPDSEVLDRILQISPVTVLKKPLKIERLRLLPWRYTCRPMHQDSFVNRLCGHPGIDRPNSVHLESVPGSSPARERSPG